MTKTYDIEESLPLSVDVPAWVRDDTSVDIVLTGKVTGTLSLRALVPDDVIIEGTLIYRGNEYPIRWQHTNDDGEPYGYFYRGTEGQVYGLLPTPDENDGHLHYAIGEWLGGAPKTFRAPMLAAVKAAVVEYLTEHADHARQSRHANLVQDLNRKASAYNEAAKAAAVRLDEYEAALAALESFARG
jgi:hypothetical protein